MKLKYYIIAFFTLISLNSCTEQQRARTFGGSSTIEIEPSKKFVNITWKENSIWVLTKAATTNEKREKYEFQERSSTGLLEGKIIIIEK